MTIHMVTLGKRTALAAMAAVLMMLPAISSAATGLTIQPVKIDETLKQGNTVTGTIQLTNASDGPINVDVSKQDFVPVAGAEGIQFIGRTSGVSSVIDWITVDASTTFAFAKGEMRQIPYTITAPADAEPGSHFGVVLFNATPKVDGGGSIKVGTQVGMLVLITIPGSHLQKGLILGFTTPWFIQSGPVAFSLKFQNTGTVHFEPKGTIVIRNMLGQIVATIPIEGQVALPTSIKTLTEVWATNGILLGRYTAVATVVDGEGIALTSDEVSFWAFPIWYGISFFVTVIVLFFIIRFIKKRVTIKITTR